MIKPNLEKILKHTLSLQEKIGKTIVIKMFEGLCLIEDDKKEKELTKDLISHAFIRAVGDRCKEKGIHELYQQLYSVYKVQGCLLKLYCFGLVDFHKSTDDTAYIILTNKGKEIYEKIKII